MKRKLVIWLMALVLGVLTTELLSFVLVLTVRAIRPKHFAGYYEKMIASVSDEELRNYREKAYDPILGWTNRPGSQRVVTNSVDVEVMEHYDELGARSNPLYAGNAMVSTYGESHTKCAEVNDDETWQYYLSGLLKANVQNFGVSAYGPDQALLRLELNLQKGIRSAYVVLMIQEENINRIVNTFRPFYNPDTGFALGFKPRFVVNDEDMILLPNPLKQLRSIDDAKQALSTAKANDYWFQYTRANIEVRFPFSMRLLDFAATVLADRGLVKHPFRDYRRKYHDEKPLWNLPEAQAIMERIVVRFMELSRAYDFHPVLVFLPTVKSTAATSRSPDYRAFANEVCARFCARDLIVVDVSKASFDPGRFTIRPDGGHASPYGNEIIARCIFDSLAEKHAP